MRRLTGSLTAIVLALTVGWTPAGADAGTWTVMLYLVGDDDQASSIEVGQVQIMQAIAAAPRTRGVNFVAQLDRSARGTTETRAFHGSADYTGASRYVLGPARFDELERSRAMGEINSGAAEELTDFMRWARESYPAEHYALVLAGHGSGILTSRGLGGYLDDRPGRTPSRRSLQRAPRHEVSYQAPDEPGDPGSGLLGLDDGAAEGLDLSIPVSVGYDSSPGGDSLTFFELREVLGAFADGNGGGTIDVLTFYSCYAGTLEGLYEIREGAKYVVASPKVSIIATKNQHDPFARQLHDDPEISAEGLARGVVEAVAASARRNETDEIVSAWKMSEFAAVGRAYSTFAEKLIEVKQPDASLEIQSVLYYDQARQGTEARQYADAGRLAHRVARDRISTTTPELRRAARWLEAALGAAQVGFANVGTWGRIGEFAGLSIFFPAARDSYTHPTIGGELLKREYYRRLAFARDTLWDEFLDALHGVGSM